MNERAAAGPSRLARLLSAPLRAGTLVAVALVAVGLAWQLLSGATDVGDDHAPLIETVLAGGPSALIGVGLLLLTLVPLAVATGAVIGFWRPSERRYLLASVVVVVLLVVSLAVSLLLLAPST